MRGERARYSWKRVSLSSETIRSVCTRQVLVAGIPLGSLRRGGGKIGQAQQIDEIAVAGKSQLAHEADHRGGRYIALMGKRADAFILDGMDILHHILVDFLLRLIQRRDMRFSKREEILPDWSRPPSLA